MNKYLEKVAQMCKAAELTELAEMQKEAGNRLVQYISEHRGNFPLSRLKDLSSKGVLKTPEQLLPGRELGTENIAKSIAKKRGFTQGVEQGSPSLFYRPGTMYMNRGHKPMGDYNSLLGSEKGTPTSIVSIPGENKPITGDYRHNISSLGDTHIGRHELFEVDEGARQIAKGHARYDAEGKATPDGNKVYSHFSPAVLMRESRDMADNPYAHISPPSVHVKKVYETVKNQPQFSIGSPKPVARSELAVDTGAGLNPMRTMTGENRFIQHLQGGKPYQSAPTSSDIRRARNLPDSQATALSKKYEASGLLEKAKRTLSVSNDQLRGNKAWRS